jgi:hypothetical protein
MEPMIKNNIQKVLMITAVSSVLALTGCSSKQAINFNVHTEPEGAHVIYQQDSSKWIYLGVTPLNLIEEIPGGKNTITLKAMRCGYLEQAKEWRGDELQKESKEKGMIFWTPRLIKDTQ